MRDVEMKCPRLLQLGSNQNRPATLFSLQDNVAVVRSTHISKHAPEQEPTNLRVLMSGQANKKKKRGRGGGKVLRL